MKKKSEGREGLRSRNIGGGERENKQRKEGSAQEDKVRNTVLGVLSLIRFSGLSQDLKTNFKDTLNR